MTKEVVPAPGSRWYTALLLALVLLVLASPQHYRDDFHSANEASRIYATMALVDHGTFHIDPVFDQYFPGWRSRGQPPNTDMAVRDGHYLLDKAPGITLLSVPVLALIRVTGIEFGYAHLAWLLSLLFSAIPTLLFVLLLVRRLRRAVGESALAQLVGPGIVFASPWLFFGAQLFSHALSASLVGAGTLLALGPLSTESPDRRQVREGILGGLCLGGAVLVEYPCAIVAASVCLAAAIDANRRKRLPWIVVGGVGPALVLLTWNTLVFGSPLAFSYGFKANPVMVADHAQGLYGLSLPSADALYGLLLSPQRGLFFLAPWLVAGLIGAVWVWRDRRFPRSWRTILLIGVVGIPIFFSGFGGWHGGHTLGPRYLLFCFPLYGIAAAVATYRISRHRLAPLFLGPLAGLVLSSFALCLAAHVGFPYVSSDVVNPVFEVVLPVLFEGGPSPTIWSPLIGAFGFGILLLACLVVLALLVRRALRRTGGDGPRTRAAPPGHLLSIAFLAVALTLHLLVGTLATTPDRNTVKHERAFAHDLQCYPEMTPRHCEARDRIRSSSHQ